MSLIIAIALYLTVSLLGAAWMIGVLWLNRISNRTTERPLPWTEKWRPQVSQKRFIPEYQHD